MKSAVANKPVKPLNPRSADTNVMGPEPTWREQPISNRTSQMTAAFSWYNYFYGKKDARDMIVNYLELHGRKADVRALKGVPDSDIRLTAGWLCRMSMVGLDLSDHEQIKLDNMLTELVAVKQQEVTTESAEPVAARLTIQDRLREKVSECAGELDGLFDEFILGGAKMSADYKPIMLIRGMNVAPQMVSSLADIWKRKQAEFEEVAKGKDAQLVEGYGYLSKIQLRNVLKFCETVINDCGTMFRLKRLSASHVQSKQCRQKNVQPSSRSQWNLLISNSRDCLPQAWWKKQKPGCMTPRNAS